MAIIVKSFLLRAPVAFAGVLLGLSGLSSPAMAKPLVAKPAEVRVTVESEMHFGTFMIFGSGRRTLGVNGTVIDNSIIALEGTRPSPAQFTVSYDRGNESRHVLDIEIELYITAPDSVQINGVTGRLSALETNIPGASRPAEGQPIRITIPNCRTRVCSRSFSIGGTLDVTRAYGGASLTIPILFDAILLSDDRQRR